MEIRDYFKFFWFYRYLILLCGILGIVTATIVALRNPKVYQAAFTLHVVQTDLERSDFQKDYYFIQVADQLTLSLAAWLNLPEVKTKIIQKAELGQTQMQPTLSVEKIGPRMLQIRWVGSSREILERLANSTAAVTQEEVHLTGISPSFSDFKVLIEKPVILDISQSKKVHAVVGFFAGSMLGLLLAFIVQFFTPIIRFSFEVPRLIGKNPILITRKKDEGDERRADFMRLLLEKEGNTNLLFLPLTRSNFRLPLLLRDLAYSFSAENKTVILVDADLTHGSLSALLGVSSAKGLAEFVETGQTLSELARDIYPKVYCLPAGKLSRSENEKQVFSRFPWEKAADFVRNYGASIFFAPPAEETLESIRVGKSLRTIFVVELGRSKVRVLEQAVALWKAKNFDFDAIILE